MKRYLTVILFICFIVSSCARISYNTETGDMTYFRIGDQNIEGFTFKSGEFEAGFSRQESDAEALNRAVKIIERITGRVFP